MKSKSLPFPSSSPTPKILKEGKNVSYAFYDTDFRFWVLEVSEKFFSLAQVTLNELFLGPHGEGITVELPAGISGGGKWK